MKKLEIDEQTLDDLRIFSKRDSPGIFDLYNKMHTRGAENLLREMFLHPLADVDEIRRRSSLLAYFTSATISFPFNAELFDQAEKYIQNRQEAKDGVAGPEMAEQDIQNGVTAIIKLLHELNAFMMTDAIKHAPSFSKERENAQTILQDVVFAPVFKERGSGKIAYSALTAFDLLFRKKEYEKIEQLLKQIYYIDVCVSVASVAREKNLIFPEVHSKGSQVMKIEGLYHPELEKPVANNVMMEGDTSLIFLTGANMAGKSTFLRAISTAQYLAHMGFPVAASSMAFSVMDGIYTTINLPDNLGIGASHFYAEVLRVKKIATELKAGKMIFVIFDELFRGTNVKDAHEATVAISKAFMKKTNCRFIISSHIVEAAEDLSGQPEIAFSYLPTQMKGSQPEYTYKLVNGVTDDRHGMVIIRNEGILDILKNGKKKTGDVQKTVHTY